MIKAVIKFSFPEIAFWFLLSLPSLTRFPAFLAGIGVQSRTGDEGLI